MRPRSAAGESRERGTGDLRRAHRGDARAGTRACRHRRGQQGRRVDGVCAGNGRHHGPAVKEKSLTDPGSRAHSGTRSVARKLALQALYRWQLNAAPWQDLVQEFGDAEDMARADRDYFRVLVEGVWHAREQLDLRLASWGDREPRLLDPIEHAVLLLGLYEL